MCALPRLRQMLNRKSKLTELGSSPAPHSTIARVWKSDYFDNEFPLKTWFKTVTNFFFFCFFFEGLPKCHYLIKRVQVLNSALGSFFLSSVQSLGCYKILAELLWCARTFSSVLLFSGFQWPPSA